LITPIGSGAALQAAPDGGEHEGARDRRATTSPLCRAGRVLMKRA
jgi:hypothetical protein